jgi:hypothetical protein
MGDLRLDQAAATLVGRRNEGGQYLDGIIGKMAMAAAAISVGIMIGSCKARWTMPASVNREAGR